MLDEFRKELEYIDSKISTAGPEDWPQLFSRIPLEVFGAIQIDRPEGLPNLDRELPVMPTADVQRLWTGAADRVLLGPSVTFIRALIGNYAWLAQKPVSEASVLDFGCGWGRLTRLLYKYIPYDRIWGVDPNEKSISICRECALKNPLAISEYLPRSLPITDKKFDLIFAFSVHTHLSEKATRISLATLRDNLNPEGVIAVTIRPAKYWRKFDFESRGMEPKISRRRVIEKHQQNGFVFIPKDIAPIEGEVTYGATSMTLAWLEEAAVGLTIRSVEWTNSDSLQIVVFLGHA